VPQLERIWIKRAKLGPMDPVDHARALAGRGLVGNANQRGRRQVTLLSAEHWADATRHLGLIDPRVRRANLLLSGIDLRATRGQTLRVGAVRIRILGETRPCERMDEVELGLRHALAAPWAGGAFGEVLDDGDIAVGDEAAWE
jgi:MOSC domain-containing protein YiiM